MLITLLALFVGCQADEQPEEASSEQTSSVTTEEETQMNTPIYNESTDVFGSFADLKKNAGLFQSQVPCTRSTKGYYASGDGGAATYLIVSEKPEGISENLGNGTYAVLSLGEGETSFSAKQLGAKGDGKINDTIALKRALQLASENEWTLVLPQGDYYIKTTLDLDHVNVQSQNAKISFYGMDSSVPGINVKDHVNVYGKLHVWMIDNMKNNDGGRSAVGFGNYGSGAGAHNCYFEELEVSGGYTNCNGVFITGDSSNITLDKVVIPAGTPIGRGILVHWGNASQHYPVDHENRHLGYAHAPNADPTKHPHDIHVGTLICNDIDDDHGKYPDMAAFYISGAYNITVDEIVADNMRTVVTISGGDIGLTAATPEEQAHGMKNLVFKKITATNVYQCGIVYSVFSSYKVDNLDFYGELELGEVDISYTALAPEVGMALHGLKKLRANSLTFRNLNRWAVHFNYGCDNAEINTVNLIDCKDAAIYVTHKDGEPACENITVGEVNANAGCGKADATVVYAYGAKHLRIGAIKLSGATYGSIASVDSTCADVFLESVTATGAYPNCVIYARDAVTTASEICVGDVSCGTAALTGGASCQLVSNG